MHIGLEIAYSAADGTMVKVKTQTETAEELDEPTLYRLYMGARTKALATFERS